MAYTSQEKKIALSQLYLDPNNYRFIDNRDYTKVTDNDITKDIVQKRTQKLIEERNQEGIKDLISSFKANGYLPVDMIQAKEIAPNKYLIIEGNRRVTALKFLKDEYERHADIGNFEVDIFENVPITIYDDADDTHHLILMGLKHINGNKKWAAINQAQYIKDLKDKGKPIVEIREALGISTQQINRYLRTLALIEQYKESDFGEFFSAEKFNMFDEILRQPKLRIWVDWDENNYFMAHNDVNLYRLFSWISPFEMQEDLEIKTREPIITRGEDIRKLAELIEDEKLLKQMEEQESIWKVVESSNFKNKNSKEKVEDIVSDIKNQVYEVRRLAEYLSDDNKETLQKTHEELKETLQKQGYANVLDDEGIKRNIYADLGNTTHFSEVTIYKGKNFIDARITNIQKINVFAGINNTGKTTLLEAIYVLLKQNDLYAYFEMQKRRAKIGAELPAILLDKFFTEWQIEGNYFGNKSSISLKKEGSSNGRLSKILANAKFGEKETTSEVHLYANKSNPIYYEQIVNIANVVFLSPFSASSWKEIANGHNATIQSGAYSIIISFIRENIDNGLIDIQLVEEFGLTYFWVTHQDNEKTGQLTAFGEGLQRIFLMALQFAAARNGVLLIDEFENAIHHGLMNKFIPLMIQLADKFCVQIFLTTHSLECVDSFLAQEKYDIMSFYRIEMNKAGKLLCKYQSGEDYANLRNNFGIDLRG